MNTETDNVWNGAR